MEGWRDWSKRGTKNKRGWMRDGGIREHRGQRNKLGGMRDGGIGEHRGQRNRQIGELRYGVIGEHKKPRNRQEWRTEGWSDRRTQETKKQVRMEN